MSYKSISSLLFLSILSLCGLSHTADLQLAKGDKAQAIILLPASPDYHERQAAEELALHLKKITGAEFPIVGESKEKAPAGPVLSVGRTRLAAKLANDGQWPGLEHREAFRVKRAGKVIVLRGNVQGDAAGLPTRHAAYAFLEHLGVRWFLPGQYGLRFRRISDLRIGKLDLVDAPTMDLRMAFNHGFNSEGVWPARNRDGGRNIEMVHKFFKRGGALVDQATLRREHPDWFFNRDGKRGVCITRPLLRKRFIESQPRPSTGRATACTPTRSRPPTAISQPAPARTARPCTKFR